jgi:hypothetical protein
MPAASVQLSKISDTLVIAHFLRMRDKPFRVIANVRTDGFAKIRANNLLSRVMATSISAIENWILVSVHLHVLVVLVLVYKLAIKKVISDRSPQFPRITGHLTACLP